MRQIQELLALVVVLAVGTQSAAAQSVQLDSFTTSLSSVHNTAALTIHPSTGNVAVTSHIGTINACSVEGLGGNVVFNNPPGSGPAGATISLSWTTFNATGANPCTPTQGTGTNWASQGAAPAIGSRSVTLPGTPGQVSFGMQCNTGAGIVATTHTVIVNTVDIDCQGSSPDVMPVVSFPDDWGDVFGGTMAFPNPLGTARNVTIPTGSAVALRITGSFSIPNGTLETAESSGNPGGPIRMSLSKCPGDFRDQLNVNNLCLYRGGTNQATLTFVTGQGTNENFCGLTAATQYYVNLTHKVPRWPAPPAQAVVFPSECEASQCVTLLRALSLGRAQSEALGIPYVEPVIDSSP